LGWIARIRKRQMLRGLPRGDLWNNRRNATARHELEHRPRRVDLELRDEMEAQLRRRLLEVATKSVPRFRQDQPVRRDIRERDG
jgi:hypothetical protein